MALVEALPLSVLLILTECAVGGFLVLLLTDLERRVSPGFLISSGLILTGDGLIIYLLKFGYGSSSDSLAPYVGGLTVLFLVYVLLVSLKRRSLARVAGGVALLVGVALLYLSAPLQQRFELVPGLVAVALATLVLGTSVTGLLLGHWYLVTPLLSTVSLRRVTELLLVGLALQVVFFAAELATGEMAATVLASNGFAFWFRILVGLVGPIILGVLTWRACQLRAMQTATGFLYIVVGCVLAGDAASKVLLVMTSLSL